MPDFRYTGNPGYEICPPNAPSWVPVPGEVYDLPASHDLGDEFEPVKGKTSKATAKDEKPSGDPDQTPEG